jgi:hypothetical protein
MQYSVSMPFRGDTDKAFSLAESALTAIGFRLTEKTAGSVEMVGPGMNDNRQSPLVGASRIHISSRRGELALEADLGGVVWISRFVQLFPLGLCLFLAVLFSVVFGMVFGPGIQVFAVAGPLGGIALLWLFLGPLIARRIRARTCRGLDTLLANMVAVGEPGERFSRNAVERGRVDKLSKRS